MKATSLLSLTLMLVTLSACGVVIRHGAFVAEDADLRSGITFAWNQVEDRAVGDPRLEGNRFFEERLHEAIEWQLSLRGIHYDESSPDLLAHHHLSLADHELARPVTDDSGRSETEVYTYEQGTVVVHLVDVRTKRDVWIAWAEADIEMALRGPDNMRGWVYDLVGQMFEEWPVLARVGRP
jgi:hypothetical protein